MSLYLWQDGVDNASIATIPENGNFKCVGGSFLVKKNPFAYTENKLILRGGFSIDLFDGSDWRQITNRDQIEFDPVANLDVGEALEFGRDYYVYIVLQGKTPELVVSLNSTYPNGATANNSRRVGGFHVGTIRKVADDGSWCPVDSAGNKWGSSGTKWQDNVTKGIIPNAVWDLRNRPKTLMPGLAKVGNKWSSIYQASTEEVISFMDNSNGLPIKSGKLQSKYGAIPVTGTEGCNMYNFNELAQKQGMQLPTYAEWLDLAWGSPQGEDGSNNYGWTKTTNSARTYTGCQVNTSTGKHDISSGVKPYAVSAHNIVDCSGNVYEWTSTFSSKDTGSFDWRNVLGKDQGQAYLVSSTGLAAFICGGSWGYGVRCGPRSVNLIYCPWFVYSDIGCRLVCDSL